MVDETALIYDEAVAVAMKLHETWNRDLRPQNGDVIKIVAVRPEGFGVMIMPETFHVAFSTHALNVRKEDLRAVTN